MNCADLYCLFHANSSRQPLVDNKQYSKFKQKTMSRGLARKEMTVSAEDSECNCFGYNETSQQYFLSKQKSLEFVNKPAYHTPTEEQLPVKSSGKRSLRKNVSPPREQPGTARSIDYMQDYFPSNYPEAVPLKKESTSRQGDTHRYSKGIKTERSIQLQERRVAEPVIARNNNFKSSSWQVPNQTQYFYSPFPPMISPPKTIERQSNMATPIKINFSHSPAPQKYSPQVSPRDLVGFDREGENKKVGLSEFKEEVKIHVRQSSRRLSPQRPSHEEILEFQLTQDNTNSPRNMPVQKRKPVHIVHYEEKPKNLNHAPKTTEYFKFGETFQSRIEKPKSNKKQAAHRSKIESHKSRIDTKKSGIGEIGKSKVRSLREQKKSLKKIDDVQEIRSMIDSDEISEDEESVVLGRLHEYGSMLDPTLSITTPTLRSKLISMNTQSSTINKSYLKPFQFNLERTHFK